MSDPAVAAALRAVLIDLDGDDALLDPLDYDSLAAALIARLDAAGLRIVGARTGTLAEGRSMFVELPAFQQILGERNALRARVCSLEISLQTRGDAGQDAEWFP